MDILTPLARRLGDALLAQQARVTAAESCTGGGIAEAITRIPGSSAWFEAGYVTYSNAQKTAQLGVPAELFASVGAVSREVVEAMARGAHRAGWRHAGQAGRHRLAGLDGWPAGTYAALPVRRRSRRCAPSVGRGGVGRPDPPGRRRKSARGVGECGSLCSNTGYLYSCLVAVGPCRI
jgi:hypothetical protein